MPRQQIQSLPRKAYSNDGIRYVLVLGYCTNRVQGYLSGQEFYMSPVTTFLSEVPCVQSWHICGPGVCSMQSWKVSGPKLVLTLLDNIG